MKKIIIEFKTSDNNNEDAEDQIRKLFQNNKKMYKYCKNKVEKYLFEKGIIKKYYGKGETSD